MKSIKLFMCLLFIAFTFPVLAQEKAGFSTDQDTVLIRLQGSNQVLIIGNSLRTLATYKRADSLKASFFSDLDKSLQTGSFPELPKRIHYFVSPQGKRRLKAEINEEFAAKFDLGYEKTRMNLDLPPLHYTIYDLRENVEIHFFLEDSAAFELAATTMLSPALQLLEKDKKKLNQLSAYRLHYTGFGYEAKNRKKQASIQLTGLASIGATLIGNQLSPVINYEIFLSIPAYSRFRLGFSYNGFVLSDFTDGQFRNINPGTFWHGMLQWGYGEDKDQWLGLSFGQISNKDANGLPGNVFKVGVITHHHRNSFALDVIHNDNTNFFKNEQRRNMLMLTYQRTIF